MHRAPVKILLICLSLSIVNWGLQYKMSLYRNVNGVQSVAKLWTGNKDAAVSDQTQAAVHDEPPILIASILLPLFVSSYRGTALVTFLQWHRTSLAWTFHQISFREFLFFRPPPSVA